MSDENWCDCHLNNGMVCANFYDASAAFKGHDGYCLHCGHKRKCHEMRDDERATTRQRRGRP